MKFSPPHNYDLMVNAAVRYSLGRKSYIVSSVCDYIVANYDTLTDRCVEVIVKDIGDAIIRKDLGQAQDKIQWLALSGFIEKQQKEKMNV